MGPSAVHWHMGPALTHESHLTILLLIPSRRPHPLSMIPAPQRSQKPGVRHSDLMFAFSGWLSGVIWKSAALMVSILNTVAPARWASQCTAKIDNLYDWILYVVAIVASCLWDGEGILCCLTPVLFGACCSVRTNWFQESLQDFRKGYIRYSKCLLASLLSWYSWSLQCVCHCLKGPLKALFSTI